MRITPLQIDSEKKIKEILASLKVSPEGIKIISPKGISLAFKIEGIRSWEANIIKQHLLSLGSDAALCRSALIKNIKTDIVIFGSLSQLNRLCEKLKYQPFTLRKISQTLSSYLGNFFKEEFILRARDKILKVNQPILCGIINVTPDSFSGDGLLKLQASGCKLQDLILEKTEEMIRAGAKIIDVGGESSRPFSKSITEEEEIRRIIPAIKAIRKNFRGIIISADTYKFKVAKIAVEEGADIINDITALRKSPQIASLIKKHRLGCVLMHMQGSPQNMQINPKYKNVTEEIVDFFQERLTFCEKHRIEKEQLLLDPGIGFGKNVNDNFKIINELYKFKVFGRPLFLGSSRKSFIGKTINAAAPQRILATAALSVIAYLKGAHIFRVHDVKENAQALKIALAVINN